MLQFAKFVATIPKLHTLVKSYPSTMISAMPKPIHSASNYYSFVIPFEFIVLCAFILPFASFSSFPFPTFLRQASYLGRSDQYSKVTFALLASDGSRTSAVVPSQGKPAVEQD